MRGLAVVVVAACGSGAPKPDGTIVASDQNAMQIVTDASFVYWTEYQGGVFKTPLDARDTPPITVVDRTMTPAPAALAIDATSLYWSDAGSGSATSGAIMSVALDGGAPVTVVSGVAGIPASWLAIDATRIYWTNQSGVWAVAKTGGLVQRIAIAEQDAEAIVVQGTRAYWTNPQRHAIRTIDLADPNAIATDFQPAGAMDLAADSANLYWLEFDTSLDAILMAAPLAGGAPVMLDKRLSPEGDVSGGVATDGTHVYWSSDTAVMRIGVDGTGVKTLAAHNQGLRSMALGPSDVYWGADQMVPLPNGSEATSGIRSTPK